jgi:hypothetical protein
MNESNTFSQMTPRAARARGLKLPCPSLGLRRELHRSRHDDPCVALAQDWNSRRKHAQAFQEPHVYLETGADFLWPKQSSKWS